MGVAHVQLDILDYIEVREMERWGGESEEGRRERGRREGEKEEKKRER